MACTPDLGVLPGVRRNHRTASSRDRLSLLGTERLDIVPVGATSSGIARLGLAAPRSFHRPGSCPIAGATVVDGRRLAATWRTSHFREPPTLRSVNSAASGTRTVRDASTSISLAVSLHVQPAWTCAQTVERSVKYGFLLQSCRADLRRVLPVTEVLRRLAHTIRSQYALVGRRRWRSSLHCRAISALSEHLGFAPCLRASLRRAPASRSIGLLRRPCAAEAKARRASASRSPRAALYGLLYVLLRSGGPCAC